MEIIKCVGLNDAHHTCAVHSLCVLNDLKLAAAVYYDYQIVTVMLHMQSVAEMKVFAHLALRRRSL